MNLKRVINQISPSKKEQQYMQKLANSMCKKLTSKDKKAIIGGSFAKKTNLQGSYDIDIYVKFNYQKYKGKDISKILGKILKRKFIKIKKVHGSRDYYQIKRKNLLFEIVPLLDIKNVDQAVNITDVSPFHTRYVKKHPKLKDEIRLTKKFLKANNIYGAESYIKGFSGYVAEILTIHYGSFEKLVKAAAKWKEKTYIGDKRKIKKLNKSKLHSPLIILDPVDSTRNAAAVVSKERYNLFIQTCKLFLKHPSKEFFNKRHLTVADLEKESKHHHLIVLKVKPYKGKKDIIGSKLLKAFEYIKNEFFNKDFIVLKSGWSWERKYAYFYYIVDCVPLFPVKKHYGPPKDQKEKLKEFKTKWKKFPIHKEKGRVYINLPRDFISVKPFIKQIIKNDYIKRRTKKVQIIFLK